MSQTPCITYFFLPENVGIRTIILGHSWHAGFKGRVGGQLIVQPLFSLVEFSMGPILKQLVTFAAHLVTFLEIRYLLGCPAATGCKWIISPLYTEVVSPVKR